MFQKIETEKDELEETNWGIDTGQSAVGFNYQMIC